MNKLKDCPRELGNTFVFYFSRKQMKGGEFFFFSIYMLDIIFTRKINELPKGLMFLLGNIKMGFYKYVLGLFSYVIVIYIITSNYQMHYCDFNY